MTQRLTRILSLCLFSGLLLFGGYVLFTFIGANGHITILLPADVWRPIAERTDVPFFRGLLGLLPFLKYLTSQLRPFLPYAIICGLLYAAYVTYRVLKTGKIYLDVRLSALHVLLLSLGSLWLLTTTLFYGTIPGIDQRLLIEPKPEVYENIEEEGLTVLQENFDQLLEAGCLTEDAMHRSKGGARVFSYNFLCVQSAFMKRIFSQALLILFLILDFLILGRGVFSLLRLRPKSSLVEGVMSIGLGSAAVIFLLWVFAFFGILLQLPVWGLLLLIPLLLFRETWYWLKTLSQKTWQVQCSFHALSLFLAWLLISYLMFNFLTVIRPFPIGWDDLGRYINLPRQLSSFGSIIPGLTSMQWEYLTSLGFVLFGYSSTTGSVLAQEINWMAGLFAIFSIFLCTRLILGGRTGILAALFYYTLPMVGHFSFADMKTENALLAFGALGFVAVLLFLSERLGLEEKITESPEKRWLFIAGILFAAAFGTKPTIVLLFFMAGVILTVVELGTLSAFGTALISFGILSKVGGMDLATIVARATGFSHPLVPQAGFLLFSLVGFLLLLFPFFRRKKVFLQECRLYGIAVLTLLIGFLAYSGPWMIRNMAQNERIAIAAALTAPNAVTPWIEYKEEALTSEAPPGSRGLPTELQPDLTNERCIGTSREEELDRYWGFGTGFVHYLGVPWRVVMNQDSQGYYLVTSAFLLLLPLILLLPAFWKNRALRLLFFCTLLQVIQWIFVGNGIPWYGIGMFLGFAVCTEAFAALAPDVRVRSITGVLLLICIGTAFSLRMWQFQMQRNLYEYAWGKASSEVLREMTIPDYDDVTEHVERLSQNPERPFLYRAGTFISYFIPKNLTVIVQNDNQLGFFNCLNQEEDHALTLKRLQALGFHSIVFDTNTATIEADPNGTLHQKVKRFINFANDQTLGIISVVNNPGLGIAYMILP